MTANVDTTPTPPPFWWPLILILLAAGVLRGIFPTADPPWQSTVGIVWHDEGAWVHNARNMALFGAWVQDRWNPVYVAPVFTALEYLSFAAFGVGLWQARLVSELSGLLAVALLACGMRRLAGRDPGLIAGVLLATNYIGVMWDRAALLEASMVAFVVAGWYCYVRAQTRPHWGALAAACALLAFFTKAAAAFFVAAIGIDVVLLYLWPMPGAERDSRRAAVATVGGFVVCGAVALALFVVPHWTDYQFYNWQMSVTRKPSYDTRSLLNRVTWFPIVHDIFTRLWFLVVVGMVALLGALARWRRHRQDRRHDQGRDPEDADEKGRVGQRPSANRITLLRDADGDGVAEIQDAAPGRPLFAVRNGLRQWRAVRRQCRWRGGLPVHPGQTSIRGHSRNVTALAVGL